MKTLKKEMIKIYIELIGLGFVAWIDYVIFKKTYQLGVFTRTEYNISVVLIAMICIIAVIVAIWFTLMVRRIQHDVKDISNKEKSNNLINY